MGAGIDYSASFWPDGLAVLVKFPDRIKKYKLPSFQSAAVDHLASRGNFTNVKGRGC